MNSTQNGILHIKETTVKVWEITCIFWEWLLNNQDTKSFTWCISGAISNFLQCFMSSLLEVSAYTLFNYFKKYDNGNCIKCSRTNFKGFVKIKDIKIVIHSAFCISWLIYVQYIISFTFFEPESGRYPSPLQQSELELFMLLSPFWHAQASMSSGWSFFPHNSTWMM